MASLVQGNGRNDGDLVLRYPTCLAAPEFSAKVGIIHLNLSPQQVGLLPLSHGAQDLVVQQPGCVYLTPRWRLSSSEEIPVLAWPIR